MILINVRFPIKPEAEATWAQLATAYAEACNAEEGCVAFEWTRSVLVPNEWICIELFEDADAGGAHTKTAHFTRMTEQAPDLVSAQPQIIYVDSDAIEGWGPMGEIQPR